MRRAKHSSTSVSSTKSKSDVFDPSGAFITGSTDHALIVSRERPALIKSFPKMSVSTEAPSQFARSANASNGDADAWTPLSPTSQAAFSPRAFQSLAMMPRSASAGASAGSVGPSAFPRKSDQEHWLAGHSMVKYLMHVPGSVNFERMDIKKAVEDVERLALQLDEAAVEAAAEFHQLLRLLADRPGVVQARGVDAKLLASVHRVEHLTRRQRGRPGNPKLRLKLLRRHVQLRRLQNSRFRGDGVVVLVDQQFGVNLFRGDGAARRHLEALAGEITLGQSDDGVGNRVRLDEDVGRVHGHNVGSVAPVVRLADDPVRARRRRAERGHLVVDGQLGQRRGEVGSQSGLGP
mmetsp:Transcript_11129/g.39342  ORF Transcript_11129/g.39342 Transcript_11129/m.39342 type:complete len:349 (+) Transcript_11129:67-1113(+)